MDIQQQKRYNVVLIGDCCSDIYHYGKCERLSPEAPVPVLKETKRVVLPGMSWNVRLNMESLGGFVLHYTNTEKINKHRFIDSKYNQHLLRWDEGEHQSIQPINTNILHTTTVPDVVVISDYNKGFLPPEACKEIIRYYKELDVNIPIFVDTKKVDLSCFEGVFIKINEKEYESIEVFPENSQFIVTLGEKGTRYKDVVFPTNVVEVFDVCGAGDVFLSTLAYTYLRDKSIPSAIRCANKLASISVSHMGTYVITKDDVDEMLKGTYDLRF